MRPPVLLLAALAACSAPRLAPPDPVPPEAPAARCTLLPGTLLLLREPTASGTAIAPPRVLRLWWRECMVQAIEHDVAVEWLDGTPEVKDRFALGLHVDGEARIASAVLERPDGSTLLLAQQSVGSVAEPIAAAQALAAGLDQLAWMTRLALGDRVEPRPVGCLAATSANLDAVVAIERGLDAAQDGMPAEGIRFLRQALRMDPGSPVALDALAACHLLRNDGTEALSTLERAVPPGRTSSGLRQRMARTRLLAQALTRPADAATFDAALLALGAGELAARPHDAQARITVAIAHNLRGDFAAAEPALADLRRRMPRNALVATHHGWALLALRRPTEARRAFADAEARMPPGSLVLPRALALCEDGDRDGFERLLADALDAVDPESVAYFDLVRMLDTRTMLTFPLDGPPAAPRGAIGADDAMRMAAHCTWLLQRPALLEVRIDAFTEMAALVLEGSHPAAAEALGTTLAAGRATARSMPTTAAAFAFLGELQLVLAGQELPQQPDGTDPLRLARWQRLLAAARRRAGDHEAACLALRDALAAGSQPAVHAALVRSLREAGRADEAAAELARLRERLRTIRLRGVLLHPATGPEHAAQWNGLAP